MKPSWYLRRLQAMSTREVFDRSANLIRQQVWVQRLPHPPKTKPASNRTPFKTPSGLASELCGLNSSSALQQADRLMAGQWMLFAHHRDDVDTTVDYYYDPITQQRAPSDIHAFRIDHRDEGSVGNIKNIWELARHQHLTTLAAAYTLTKEERYAHRIEQELNNFRNATPFCQGIHWTSGIELGIRMISWVWIRRLLHEWPRVGELFENNPNFITQLGRHHQWINSFPANGSSANNHLIAESCGKFIAARAFDFFEEGDKWSEEAAHTLAEEFNRQTFSDGLNKELASGYHGFVLELVTAAYAEASFANHRLADDLLPTLVTTFDALASIVDCSGNAHQQGDADEGYGLLLETAGFDRWQSLLATGSAIAGKLSWWPNPIMTDLRSVAIQAHVEQTPVDLTRIKRPPRRQHQFPDAGQTILRDIDRQSDEIWVRFDHGPHGYLSTAAHAHADALAIEARIGGIPVLVDPGTYCYHGEPVWRDYFRSTEAHSTVEVGGQNQSQIEGPFLWSQHCISKLESFSGLAEGDVATCTASHDGYESRFGVSHQRTVTLNRKRRSITISDFLTRHRHQPAAAIRVMFHFHPNVSVRPTGLSSTNIFVVEWPRNHLHGQSMASEQAKLEVNQALKWSLIKGQTAPPMGWYSHILGHREPCWVLVGETAVEAESSFSTTLTF